MINKLTFDIEVKGDHPGGLTRVQNHVIQACRRANRVPIPFDFNIKKKASFFYIFTIKNCLNQLHTFHRPG